MNKVFPDLYSNMEQACLSDRFLTAKCLQLCDIKELKTCKGFSYYLSLFLKGKKML